MCGIVGYVGNKKATSILLDGLKRLEYRGYDSAGIALLEKGEFKVIKEKGKIIEVEKKISKQKFSTKIGIGHTRWATHGEPSQKNAHPHLSFDNKIAIVHNGIIENYRTIQKRLEKKGIQFQSDTDSEVLAHLIATYYTGDLEEAVRKTLKEISGTYGLLAIASDNPETIVGARHGSPIVVGIGQDEMFIASDVSAIVAYTRSVVYLEDNEIITITKDQYRTTSLNAYTIEKDVQEIDWDIQDINKNGFDHYMLKEIFEQPETIQNAFRGRIYWEEGTAKLGGIPQDVLLNTERIIIVACGTSYYSGLVGEYLLEEIAEIPVEVEYASEFRYRSPILNKGTIVIVISQSGETADTLAALREAQRKGARVFGITNVVGSTIARETDGGVYTHAGPEIGVASTKAFTSQIVILLLLTISFARRKRLSHQKGLQLLRELSTIPDLVRRVLENTEPIRQLARKYVNYKNILYLGRNINYPVALEGALKLKEISYIHAEGYPAAEMKHGPIALIDENMPVVVIATHSAIYDKVISNIMEVRARNGKLIILASEGDKNIKEYSEDVLYVPKVSEPLSPLINTIPLQLFAYYVAVEKGCEVDQPRNLAKSVTVE